MLPVPYNICRLYAEISTEVGSLGSLEVPFTLNFSTPGFPYCFRVGKFIPIAVHAPAEFPPALHGPIITLSIANRLETRQLGGAVPTLESFEEEIATSDTHPALYQ